ncbi:MAG: recombinase family protein, partial [Actinomycetota bacterium]
DLGGRQQLQQLLEDCQVEPAHYLLIERLEELGGSVQEVCDRITQLESLGVQLAIRSELPNSPSPVGAIALGPTPQADLIKLLAGIQRQQHSRNIRKGHAQNRLKALPPPGKAPYGYRRGKDRYTLDRSAAPVVKEFFERFLLYGSLRGAVRYLAKKYGKKISVSTGRRWLTNSVYRGDLEYKNGEVISNTHVPIVSREEAAQVDRLLRRNRRLPPRTASAPRSLAGLVVCGECHSPMIIAKVTSHRKDREYLYLRPNRCPQQPKCKALAYQEVLESIIEAICRELPLAVAALSMPDLEPVKGGMLAAIASKQEILDQLPVLKANGILDAETAQLRSYKLRTEIAQLQSQLAQLPPVNLRATAQAVSIPQFWLDLSESERRFYFREFIRQVEIIRQQATWQIQLVFIF